MSGIDKTQQYDAQDLRLAQEALASVATEGTIPWEQVKTELNLHDAETQLATLETGGDADVQKQEKEAT